MRDPERIPMILAAVEREWRKAPDLRLGQLLVNLARQDDYVLFALEDGELLRRLGAEREAEHTYIKHEPRAARDGCREWERGWIAYHRQLRLDSEQKDDE